MDGIKGRPGLINNIEIRETIPPVWFEDRNAEKVCFLFGHRIGDRTVIHGFFVVPNELAGEGDDRFGIKKSWLRRARNCAEVYGTQVVGVMHTHPLDAEPEPSEEDIDGLRAMPGLVGLICHPSGAIWAYVASGETRQILAG